MKEMKKNPQCPWCEGGFDEYDEVGFHHEEMYHEGCLVAFKRFAELEAEEDMNNDHQV